MQFDLEINGEKRSVDVDPQSPLLWVLRDELNLNGTKYSCGVAQCGACTAHLDGVPVRACVTPIRVIAGRKITTIEGICGAEADAVQEAWQDLQVPQCGYCQSGQIMSAASLLDKNPEPSEQDVDTHMAGNICRCGCYPRIKSAILAAAKKQAEQGAEVEEVSHVESA